MTTNIFYLSFNQSQVRLAADFFLKKQELANKLQQLFRVGFREHIHENVVETAAGKTAVLISFSITPSLNKSYNRLVSSERIIISIPIHKTGHALLYIRLWTEASQLLQQTRISPCRRYVSRLYRHKIFLCRNP